MDDTLFYLPKPEYIHEVIHKLRDEGMDIEEKDNVAGFLGAHIERDDSKGTITLTQSGLIKRIIDTLNLQSQYAEWWLSKRSYIPPHYDLQEHNDFDDQ